MNISDQADNVTPADRTSDAEDKQTDFFIGTPMRVANRAMKRLFPDDEFYSFARYAHVAPEDAKHLFLYGCARQVMKSTFILQQYRDLTKEPPRDHDTLTRSITEAFIDDQEFWIRKLSELLINLINFSETNIDAIYRIYLNAENLDLFAGKFHDFLDFYDFENGNVLQSVNNFKARIDDDLRALNLTNLWFLDVGKIRKDKPKPSVFTSIRTKFKSALPYANHEELAVLGPTYHEVFSLNSLAVHPAIGSRVREFDFEMIRSNTAYISLVGQHIMERVNSLAGFDDDESIQKLLDGDSIAPQLTKRLKKEFDVGDIVLAYDQLAQVVECRTSRFGYKGYKVKFLDDSALPELPDDWAESSHILRLVPRAGLRAFMERNLQQVISGGHPNVTEDFMTHVLSQPEDALMESIREPFISLHKSGVLMPMIRRSLNRGVGNNSVTDA